MGIFDTIYDKSNKRIKNSTKGFYFGASEAEGEINDNLNLDNYFQDFLGIFGNLEMGNFIFTGRKGVGKSAIAKFIKDTSDDSEESFAKILRFSDFELEKIIQSSDLSSDIERLFFEWLILVNIVKLIIKNQCGLYTTEYAKLQKFLDNNSGLVNIDEKELIEISRNKGGEVKFGVLTHAFGGVFKRYFGVKETKAPFYKMITPLKEILEIILNYETNKNNEFWILFDDLDINFNAEKESDNNRIMELIRIAKDYNNEIFKGKNARIVLFLREDMKQSVVTKFPDSAKIFSSYEIVINWYDHNNFMSDENSISLKKLVNRRIKLNFENNGIAYNDIDPWSSLFKNISVGDKKSFKYVADFTFYRPRDFITFLSIIGKENYTFPIDRFTIKKILEKYIPVNIREIKSELSLFFTEPEKDLIFQEVLRYVANNINLSYPSLKRKIDSLNFSKSSSKVIEILVGYSLIIFRDQYGNLYFNYRENSEIERVDKSNLSLTLHKSIYHYYKPIQ